MSRLREIVDGHVNEFKGIVGIGDEEQEKVFRKREMICVNCPLKVGNTCNKSMYINPKTLETTDSAKEGFIRGCGCRLSAKQKSPTSACPAGFWGNEFKK
jgi:hypothetical protein